MWSAKDQNKANAKSAKLFVLHTTHDMVLPRVAGVVTNFYNFMVKHFSRLSGGIFAE
jgi:hypothetical protein